MLTYQNLELEILERFVTWLENTDLYMINIKLFGYVQIYENNFIDLDFNSTKNFIKRISQFQSQCSPSTV